jgi:hypothetical protein
MCRRRLQDWQFFLLASKYQAIVCHICLKYGVRTPNGTRIPDAAPGLCTFPTSGKLDLSIHHTHPSLPKAFLVSIS